MSNKRNNRKRKHGYHHVNVPARNPIRVRSKRLDQVDEDKIALAFWLLAKQLVEDESDRGNAAADANREDEAPTEEAA